MNTAKMLAAAAFTLASLPLLAQQPAGSSDPQQTAPPPTQSQPQAMQPGTAAPTTAATASAEMTPVNGELVDKLDSKTAKTGDSVVIKTKSNVKTADGTEIPKGSKLVGKVVQAKSSGQGNDNSQVALQFDHAELKGGQSLPIRAQVVGLSASDSEMNAASSNTMASAPSAPSSGPATASSGMNGSPTTSQAPTTATAQPQAGNDPASAAGTGPAPGTVVARTGNIAIRTTSIPGVLLANNEPGQQDPRMAQSSGILLGPKRDIHLDSGTRVTVGVAASGAAAPGGGN